jgi:hypothetical protein
LLVLVLGNLWGIMLSTSGGSFQSCKPLTPAHIAHDMRANGFASIDIFDPLGGQIIIVINERKRRPIKRRRFHIGLWMGI